jgi:predicted nucleic acid-binding protein
VTWLIDTNIISEVRKGSRCHAGVAAWWATVRNEDLFLSALTLGEIRRGIEAVRPRDPTKAVALERWLREVAEAFRPRLLAVDVEVADAWGRLSAIRSVPAIDALLAATAHVHGLVLVTRNTADVSRLGVRTLNPFEDAER